MIDPELVHMLLDHVADLGTDDAGNRHFRLTRQAPESLLRDLRYAGRTEYVTAWQSPRYRAILLASEHAGRLVAFADEARYREAVHLARQGIMPELAQMRER